MRVVVLVVVLVALYVVICGARHRSTRVACGGSGTRCVTGRAAKDCQEVTLACPGTAKCCKTQRRERMKQRPCKTKKKCSREGGWCEKVYGAENSCSTITVDNLCKGNACTCCLGDKKKCVKGPKCSAQGGYCFNLKKINHCPTDADILEDGCTGKKKCGCCIPRRPCACGVANVERIVGGEEVTPPNKYPWVTGLQLDGNTEYQCSGSIINSMYILTAAHCLVSQTNFPQLLTPDQVMVVVADHDQYSDDDNLDGLTMIMEIEAIKIHPNYDPLDVENDLALLKLSENLPFNNEAIKPVCLPPDDQNTYENSTAIAAGWGFTSEDAVVQPATLMEVNVTILDPTCEGKEIANFNITENMICAGVVGGGKDACEGDSGGPLMVVEGDQFFIVGLSAFGEGCARNNTPGVYTRVSEYLDWIDTNTQEGSYCS